MTTMAAAAATTINSGGKHNGASDAACVRTEDSASGSLGWSGVTGDLYGKSDLVLFRGRCTEFEYIRTAYNVLLQRYILVLISQYLKFESIRGVLPNTDFQPQHFP